MSSLQEQLAAFTAQDKQEEKAETTTAKLQRMIAGILQEDVENIDPTKSLTQLGAGSLDIIELAVRTEMEFKFRVDAELFPEQPGSMTVAQLASLVDDHVDRHKDTANA